MKGATSVTFRKLDIDRIIELCKEGGLESIEWGGDVHVKPGDLRTAKEAAEKTEKAGLKVNSYGSYFKVGVNSDDEFKAVLETADALGAPIIRVWCGETSSAKTDEALFEKYVSQLQRMCDLAKEKEITVSCEYHGGTFNDNAQSAMKLIEKVNRDNYKTYWQTVAYTEEDLEALKLLKKYISVAHVFTWNKFYIRYSLSHKKKMWEKYIAEMKGEPIDLILEFVKNDSPKQFLKDAETLRNITENCRF